MCTEMNPNETNLEKWCGFECSFDFLRLFRALQPQINQNSSPVRKKLVQQWGQEKFSILKFCFFTLLCVLLLIDPLTQCWVHRLRLIFARTLRCAPPQLPLHELVPWLISLVAAMAGAWWEHAGRRCERSRWWSPFMSWLHQGSELF